MKCQRHDELTILSNRWSGADERANASIVPIHSLVPTNHLVLVVLSLTSRYVFMHINYLEPKPLIQCSFVAFESFFRPPSYYCSSTLFPPLSHSFVRASGKKNRPSLCPPSEIIVFQLTRLFASKAGLKIVGHPRFRRERVGLINAGIEGKRQGRLAPIDGLVVVFMSQWAVFGGERKRGAIFQIANRCAFSFFFLSFFLSFFFFPSNDNQFVLFVSFCS